MSSELLQSLKKPQCYPHPVRRIKAVDLGSSWIILTGDYAYKLNKPLASAVPDCSAIVSARFTCDEELRLNRRLAPGFYLGVVEVRGTPAEARIGGSGPILGYALRLRQFRHDALASQMLSRGRLTAELMQKLARKLAHFHGDSCAPHSRRFGSAGQIYRRALGHIDKIERLARRSPECSGPLALHAWIDAEFMRRSQSFQARWEGGMVRECHGDLRLSKLVLLDGELVPIAGASGRAERWCDPMSDISMLLMELLEWGASELALRFLNAYLEESGDYAGLAVLRFYLVERAGERAYLHLVHARHSEHGSVRERRHLTRFNHSLALAEALTQSQGPGLIQMHGVTDGARSEMASAIADALQAITLRYDAELSRIQQSRPAGKTPPAPLWYVAASAAHEVYEALAKSVLDVLRGDYLAVIDAPSLLRFERDTLARSARAAGAPVVIVTTHPSKPLLRAAWMAGFAPRDVDDPEGRLLRIERELFTIENIVAPEELAIVDLDARGLTPKVLERIRDALEGRAREEAAEPARHQAKPEVVVPEPA
jgi:aminoglycoside phosphotransferase family enzyme/predicted kinase